MAPSLASAAGQSLMARRRKVPDIKAALSELDVMRDIAEGLEDYAESPDDIRKAAKMLLFFIESCEKKLQPDKAE